MPSMYFLACDLDLADYHLFKRQIFLSQPNRSYSRSISISENHVRLVHYDRSGGYCTPLINIHEDPQTFVRLVLGLASTNESILGLDTRFQWTTHVISGRKVAGTLTTRTPSGLEKAYRIKASPQFQRDIIRGRGTICWDAVDPETNRHVLLKIAWRATPRRSETVYLEMARGVSGIVQMLAFEDDTVDTKSFRPSGFSLKDFSNRVQLLLVLDLYGPSVWHFRSRIQLLSAFRAAMAGEFEHGMTLISDTEATRDQAMPRSFERALYIETFPFRTSCLGGMTLPKVSKAY